MAAVQSATFVPFVLPPSKMSSCNNYTPWPTATSDSACFPDAPSDQTIRRSAAPSTWCSGDAEVGNTLARGEGTEDDISREFFPSVNKGCDFALLDDDDQSDEDLPPVEQVLQRRRYVEPDLELQHIEQPALHQARIPSNQTGPELGNRQGDSLEQPVILGDDEPDDAGTRDEAEQVSPSASPQDGQDANARDTLAVSRQEENLDLSGPWYDVEEGRWVDDEPALGLEGVSEPAPLVLPEALDNGDERRSEDALAAPEKEPWSALEEGAESSEDSRNAHRHDTSAHNIEVVEEGIVAVMQRQEGEVPAQEEGRRQSALVEGESGQQHPEETSLATRGTSSTAVSTPASEPALGKRKHRDAHVTTSSDNLYSLNADGNHDTCNSSDEDARPLRRRKLRAASAGTRPPLQPPCLGPPSARLETDEAQTQGDHGCVAVLDNELSRDSQTSRSPSTAAEPALSAEYQEWAFHGFLKRTTIGADVTYNLEFQLPPLTDKLDLPIHPQAFGISTETPVITPGYCNAVTQSKMHQASKPQNKRVRWTESEDTRLCEMREDNYSWDEIHAALPTRSKESIQVRYSTRFKK